MTDIERDESQEEGTSTVDGDRGSGELRVSPGRDVLPAHLRDLGHAPVVTVAGVGPMETWISWGSVDDSGAIHGALQRKRCGWDEARRLRELAREIDGLEEGVDARRRELEGIAARPNPDVLSTSEALAELAPEKRVEFLARCRRVLVEAGGVVGLERAMTLAGSVPNDDIRAPREVPEVLLWLLGTREPPSEEQGVLDWVLGHEEGGSGLTGLIAQCDALFHEVTGRRPSSTHHSRVDRAASLRFRIQAMATAPAPADVVIASPIDGDSADVEMQEGSPFLPEGERPRISRPDPQTWVEVLEATRKEVQELRAEVHSLREAVQADVGDAPFIGTPHTGQSGRWWLIAAALLLVGAGVLTFARSGDAPVSSATEGLAAGEAPVKESIPTAPEVAPSEPSLGKVVEAPPSSPEPSGKEREEAPSEPEGVVTPEPEVSAPEPSPEAPLKSAPAEVVEAVAPSGVEDPAARPAAPEPPEVAAERYGVGIQPTHRLTGRSKLHRFEEKDFVEVTDLPGGDALVNACIVSLARPEEYRRKIYQGYHPVRLSCAGEMKVICGILGCSPEQSCVTSASWVKPCRK